MAELTVEGLRAGALGFSTSRTLNHRSADGKHIPTLRAEEAELTAIARAMRKADAGWLQIVSDFKDQSGEIGLFRRLARESGRPVTITLLQSDARPDGWRELMAEIDEANDEGLRITAQVRPRPTSVLSRRNTRLRLAPSWAASCEALAPGVAASASSRTSARSTASMR